MKRACETCRADTDHGGCEARDSAAGCPLNCCRKHMTDYDYTRDITTEYSDEDKDSIFDAMDDEVYQSSQSLAGREEDELDRFEQGKSKEELAEIYGNSSDEEHNRAGPSGRTMTERHGNEDEEEYITGHQFRQHSTMDVSDDMSPNATSTGDEQEQGLVTPGVSNEVHKMSIVEEAANKQRMEIDEKKKEKREGRGKRKE